MFSIGERVAAVAGKIFAASTPGKGTVVRIAITSGNPSALSAQDAGEKSQESGPKAVQRLIVVDDHEIFRHSLIRLLSSYSDFQIVGQASNGSAAYDLAKQVKPDTIVMDMAMPITNGVDATSLIHAEMPEIRIVGLSLHDSDTMIQAFLGAGGDAYVSKTELTENLFDALRANRASYSAPLHRSYITLQHRPTSPRPFSIHTSVARKT